MFIISLIKDLFYSREQKVGFPLEVENFSWVYLVVFTFVNEPLSSFFSAVLISPSPVVERDDLRKAAPIPFPLLKKYMHSNV